MILLLRWIAAVLLLVAIGLAVAGPGLESEEDRLDAAIRTFMDRYRIPGAVVLVGRAGAVSLEKAYGTTSTPDHRDLTPAVRFRLASLSKPLTAAAMLALVDAGRLQLDDPLGKWRPEVKNAADSRVQAITVRQLLQHRAGWDAALTFDPFFLERTDVDELIPTQRIDTCAPVARAMLAKPLQFAPGERYAYSNLGYCWLGLVIESVTGESYETAVQKLVLPPGSGLALRQQAPLAGDDSETVRNQPLLAAAILGPAGGWQGTAGAYFRAVSGALDSRILIAPEGRAAGEYYGLGWRVWPDDGPLVTHYGALPGLFAFVMRDLKGNVVVALFNGRPAEDRSGFLELKESLASQLSR